MYYNNNQVDPQYHKKYNDRVRKLTSHAENDQKEAMH